MLLQIKARAAELGLDIDFKGATDHLSEHVHGYKVRSFRHLRPLQTLQAHNHSAIRRQMTQECGALGRCWSTRA
jgi:hypothetical protein